MDQKRLDSIFSEVDDLDSATLDPAELIHRKKLADGKHGVKRLVEESTPAIHPHMEIRGSNMSRDGL